MGTVWARGIANGTFKVRQCPGWESHDINPPDANGKRPFALEFYGKGDSGSLVFGIKDRKLHLIVCGFAPRPDDQLTRNHTQGILCSFDDERPEGSPPLDYCQDLNFAIKEMIRYYAEHLALPMRSIAINISSEHTVTK
mgnify:FL=1